MCGAGSTVSCPPFTGLRDPPDPIKPADWDTRPNRVSDVTNPVSKGLLVAYGCSELYISQHFSVGVCNDFQTEPKKQSITKNNPVEVKSG